MASDAATMSIDTGILLRWGRFVFSGQSQGSSIVDGVTTARLRVRRKRVDSGAWWSWTMANEALHHKRHRRLSIADDVHSVLVGRLANILPIHLPKTENVTPGSSPRQKGQSYL